MQKHEVVRKIMKQYAERTPITKQGISILYDRAVSRGYDPSAILIGLKTVICKNYLRKEYTPPNNDSLLEALDERRYIEDYEFKEVMRNGNSHEGAA